MLEAEIDYMNKSTAAIEKAVSDYQTACYAAENAKRDLARLIMRLPTARTVETPDGKPSERAAYEAAQADLDWARGKAKKELGIDMRMEYEAAHPETTGRPVALSDLAEFAVESASPAMTAEPLST